MKKSLKNLLLLLVGFVLITSCNKDDNEVQEQQKTAMVSIIAEGDQLTYITGIVVDSNNNIFVADTSSHKIFLITSDGMITTFVGSGSMGSSDGTGILAQFDHPVGLAIDSNNNLFVAERDSNKIRKVTSAGVVTTIAGNGQSGYVNGAGTAARFNNPHDLVIDSHDNLFVVDSNNFRIRKITPDGIVTTFTGSTYGYVDGNGENVKFTKPQGITIDANDILYVADTYNNAIRKITPSGEVTTIAGGTSGTADGNGADAQFNNPSSLVVDSQNNLIVVDRYNHRIRKVTQNGDVTTIAGNILGFANGSGTDALFNNPFGITKDANGNFYITDTSNKKVRKLIFQ